MKKLAIGIFFLTSIFAIGQEKLTVGNNTEINDSNGNLFRYYGYGAKLDLVKMHDDYAEVEIDCNVYKVESKYYKNLPKITIRIGMSISDLVSILGNADDTISSETQYGVYWTYIYGNTYYHFENSKLTAINRY
ncbi:hypothetical protein [Flavobacterium sp. IMCC34518]|uniref:hypothetical protein n=1 Tax=Flavobacterium sp. IMCC34518 TaxID=3003623 RepID=UPI00248266A3|nr:hypothetical protein [Flavobacterium sp. IMCC34518]